MAKGIIVVDMPERCIECQFCRNYIRVPHSFGKETTHEIHCACLNNKALKEIPENEKPDWCPIKEIPVRLEELKYSRSMGDYQRKGFSRGWNACLDEIEGSAEK